METQRIYVESDEVMDYFYGSEPDLREDPMVLAERTDNGYAIKLGCDKDFDLPTISVWHGDTELEYNVASTAYECEILMEDALSTYFQTEEDAEDIISEREEELDNAVYALLDVVAPNFLDVVDAPDELLDTLKDRVCEVLYTNYGISTYRPMFLEDENGKEEFVKFPYPELAIETCQTSNAVKE